MDEFRFLSFERKCDLVTFEANYLCCRTEGSYKLFLYEVRGYFIEVMFSREENKVRGFNAFNEVDRLSPYLAMISIAEVCA
jgi:hypothetical protein